MDGKKAAEIIRTERKFLKQVIKDFKPEHGDFKPTPEMFSVTQQIRHIAHTITWFKEGGFGSGWDMDFETQGKKLYTPATLEQAHKELDAAYDNYIAFLETKTTEELMSVMPPNYILGEVPRVAVLHAECDHTAHHRGALSVYLRLLGLVPAMPYME